MHFSYDPEANALYIGMIPTPRAAETHFIDSGTLVDLDADGTLIGIEIINPNRAWPLDEICDRYGMTKKGRELAELLMPEKAEVDPGTSPAVFWASEGKFSFSGSRVEHA